MRVVIEINCDNAAFDDSPENEVCRILETIINDFHNKKYLYDINGNRVGQLAVKE